jgi:sialate O-acetylesterase
MLRLLLLALLAPVLLAAELPPVFGSNMVLQREIENPVWGWGAAGESVTVSIADQSHKATADVDGNWRVKLAPLTAGGPHTLTVKGADTKTFENVMVGEVWLCSGQSNMQWAVGSSNDPDLESLTAKYPNIRVISVPQVGTQDAQRSFVGQWDAITPDTVRNFSGVGYFFGRILHQALDMPIGLIDNAWGGSACEAWIRRDLLDSEERYKPLMDKWAKTEAAYDDAKIKADFEAKLAKWKENGKKGRAPRPPRNPLKGQHRPANLYSGVLKPILGYGMRGAIWYQGESNAGRAFQYRSLFPLMISSWREEWGLGDFAFYWVQLADFRDEAADPGDSTWAELREAQTMTLSLPNTGQAVTTDLGEAHDIHPKDKQNVAKRLARLALAKNYGIDIAHESPRYASMEKGGRGILVKFEHVGGGLDSFDVRKPRGLAIAGEDRKFVWAEAQIKGKDTLEVWHSDIKEPVAVRYAWADNPVCNLQSKEGLPVTPFRSDDWPGITVNALQ